MILGTYLPVDALLHDDAFKLDTSRIRAAVQLAQQLKEWVPSNVTRMKFFEGELLKHFKWCLGGGMETKEKREQCFMKFHRLRASIPFKNLWEFFLSPLGIGGVTGTQYSFSTLQKRCLTILYHKHL